MSEQAPASQLWVMRAGNVISVRRGYRTVLSMYGQDEARAVAESILEAIRHEETTGVEESASTSRVADKTQSMGMQYVLYVSAEEKQNAPHGINCSRGQAIALEISGVDCDCWKADL